MEGRPHPTSTEGSRLVLLGYPYAPSSQSGRGIDRYLSLLAAGYTGRGIPFEMLENGHFPDHLQQLLLGEPRILSRVARCHGGFWHAVSPVGGRVAVLLGRRPLVSTVHDVMPFYMAHRHPARYRFLRFCIETTCRGSDRIIVPFPSVREFLIDRLRVSEDRVSVVPYGIEPPARESVEDSESGAGSDRNETVLFFGSGNPIDRGGDIAIRAMTRVIRERPKARLLLSCKGPETETLRKLARHVGVEQSIAFLGFVPEEKLQEVFRSAMVAVFPSRLSFGLLEMYAMQSGVPMVVTDVRDQSYFVGDDALVCPPEDAEAFGGQLARLLGDEGLRKELARRGRIRVREFSPDRMVEETLRVYSSLGWTPGG